jgi:myo-inositol-1(or 4)-monophosphatase
MLPNTNPMINVAVKAARAAGSVISRASLDIDAVRISKKQANDFVTEIDAQAEDVIIETLLGAYPGHGILGEETGSTRGAPDSEYVWVIDPIDGTTNFIHGFPYYCVSIALMVRGRVEHAVIFDPSHNDLYTATRGRGAFVNDRRLRVSKNLHLTSSVLAMGLCNRVHEDHSAHFAMTAEMTSKCVALRQTGSAALDLASVAAGRVDGFFHKGLNSWDIAAGSLLVTEAGGLIGNFTGEAEFMDQAECMAGNPKVYAQMVPVLRKYSKFATAGEKSGVRSALGSATGGTISL